MEHQIVIAVILEYKMNQKRMFRILFLIIKLFFNLEVDLFFNANLVFRTFLRSTHFYIEDDIFL